MPDAASVLLQRLQTAFDTIAPGADPVLRASDRADFQANGALALGKAVGRPPRQVAEEVVAAASLDDICAEVEISGPGFINLTLSDSFVAGLVAELSADERLGVPPPAHPRPWSSTTRRPTWPRRCTSATCAARSSATRWPGCSGSSATTCGARTTSATGGRPSACSSSTCSSRRRRRRRVLQRAGPQRVLRGGPAEVRRRRGLRGALPQPRRAAAGRRRGDAAPVAHLRGRVHAPRRRGLRAARRAAHPRGRRRGELLQPAAARSSSPSWTRRACWWRTTARCACSPRDSRTATGSRSRSSCASPTAATATRRPTWPPSATAPGASVPRGSSTWSGAEQSLHLRLVFAVADAGRLPAPPRTRPSTSAFGLVLGTDGKKLASRCRGSER